jgi:hypothetical protein
VPRLLADTTPLRISPEFRRLWWGQGLATLGSQLAVVAVGLQVYALTGSTLSVGILGLCTLVPLVGLGLYGGALVDSHDRRAVALWASTGLWVVSIAIALQAWLGFRSVELLYALVALQSAAFAINNPARSAILPRLLPPELMPAANALQTLAWSVAFTVGPLLGAVLVAVVGYPVTYTIDVVTFAFALWALRRLPPMPPLVGDGDGPPRRAGLASIAEGLRYLATRPNVRMTFLVDLAAMVLSFPRVFFPAVGAVIIVGGEATAGALSSAVALGGVLAGVLSGSLGLVRAQGRAIVWAVTGWGIAVAGFGLAVVWAGSAGDAAGAGGTSAGRPVLWAALVVALVMLTLAGAADSVSSVFRQSVLQTATPDAMRGRLQGVFIVVVAGGPRLGDLVGGANATWLGEGWAAVAGGVACVVAVWLLVRRQPRFLAYDARDPQP